MERRSIYSGVSTKYVQYVIIVPLYILLYISFDNYALDTYRNLENFVKRDVRSLDEF